MNTYISLGDRNHTHLVIVDGIAWCERYGEPVTERFSIHDFDQLLYIKQLGLEAS